MLRSWIYSKEFGFSSRLQTYVPLGGWLRPHDDEEDDDDDDAYDDDDGGGDVEFDDDDGDDNDDDDDYNTLEN